MEAVKDVGFEVKGRRVVKFGSVCLLRIEDDVRALLNN